MGTIPPRRFGKNDQIKGGVEIVSDVKLLVGILEKIANICKDNMLEFKNDVDLANQLGLDSGSVSKDITARKELSREIFNVINKGLNDSKT